MSTESQQRIEYATWHNTDDQYDLSKRLEKGDIVYLSYSDYGTQDAYAYVTRTTEMTTVLQTCISDREIHLTRVDGQLYLDLHSTADTDRDLDEERDIYHLTRYPAECLDNLTMWEIHLVYNLARESSDDEITFPLARDKDEAIELARRRTSNPPEVGPVYDEGVPHFLEELLAER